MSGRPSPRLFAALRLMTTDNLSARAAAQAVGLAVSTIYRSSAYRAKFGLPKRIIKRKGEKS